MKEKVLRIALKGIEEVKASKVLDKINIEGEFLIIEGENIRIPKEFYVFGSGKASLSFTEELVRRYGDQIKGGFVVSYEEKRVGNVECLKGNHPILGEDSLKSTEKLIEEIESLGEEDFFIYILSGGSSSMLESLKPGISLEKARELNKKWIKEGLDIEEINKRRVEISEVKGGKLAERIKAKGVVLVISDVVGDRLDIIGSSPMLSKKKRFKHFIIASNKDMLRGAKEEAIRLGLKPIILTDEMIGEAKEVSKLVVGIGNYLKKRRRVCVLLSGETTVTVRGNGRGGRNQEFCLSALMQLKDKDLTVLSIASDGRDFNEYAGAVVGKKDYLKAKELGLDLKSYLENNDSTTVLEKLGCLIKTGLTGTNVMDLVVLA